MGAHHSCKFADRVTSDKSIRCSELKGQKWDFCIHQYFCREEGKYVLNNDAGGCNVKKSAGA